MPPKREGGRGDGGSDLAVASGAADSQSGADIVAGDLTPGRSISPIPTDGQTDRDGGGGADDGWGN